MPADGGANVATARPRPILLPGGQMSMDEHLHDNAEGHVPTPRRASPRPRDLVPDSPEGLLELQFHEAAAPGDDPDWWVRRMTRREERTGVLPPSISLHTEDCRLEEALDRESNEHA